MFSRSFTFYSVVVLFTLVRPSLSSDFENEIDSNDLNGVPHETNESDAFANIRRLIQSAQLESGDVDLNGLLIENVYDPAPLESFNISSSGFITNIFGQFTDLNLHGLKEFRIDRISMNLAKMNLSADMSVPILSIVGNYFLQGTFAVFPLSGEGPFWMNMSSISLRGYSLIHSTPEGKLSMGDIHLESDVEDIDLHFGSLMGGGVMSSISNSVLNQLSEMILGELKPSLLRELSSYLKHQFNDVLFQQLPKDFMDPNSSNIVDSLLSRAAEYLIENQMEPLQLKEYKEVYERNLLFVTTRGEFMLFNGTLHGLSTLKRKGDVISTFVNNSLIFEANFEFDNLTGSYEWVAEVLGASTRGNMDIQVKSVDGFVQLKQCFKAGCKMEIEALNVNNIRHVWLDLQGLGRWDYVMESVINIITNGLKLQLADAIAEPVKDGIQDQLDLLNIGIPS